MTTFSQATGQHPLVTEAKARLAMLTPKRTGPDLPLAYTLHAVHTTCSFCGSVSTHCTLMAAYRSGGSGKRWQNVYANEKVYDLPTAVNELRTVTARCLQCVGLGLEPAPEMPTGRMNWLNGPAKPIREEIDLAALGLLDEEDLV